MKKITLSIMVLFVSLGFSQNAPITFEPGAFGNTWAFAAFENGTNVAPQVVVNPSVAGLNMSATALKYSTVPTGQSYAGFESAHGVGIGTFNLTAANCTIKILVYKSVISDVAIKFATAAGGSSGDLKVANTLINQWEELTFNFASKIGEATSTGIDQIIFFPDFMPRTTTNVCYIDNVRFSAQIVPTEQVPTVAAPTPTRPAANVLSMYSNAYTNIAMSTWKTSWSPGVALTDIQIAMNDTKKYTSLDYVGIEPTAVINAASMTTFHIDAWTPNMTTFKIKLVNYGANGVNGGGDDTESELLYTPTLNGWNSYEIPMTSFTGLNSRSALGQLIFASVPAGSGTLYVDNVYFHNVAVVDLNTPQVAAPTPTRPAANVVSMFSNVYTNVTVDTWKTSWSAANFADVQIAGNDTKKYTSLDFVGVETVVSPINASAMTYFHVDAWTPNMTTFRIKLVDAGQDGILGAGTGVNATTEHELVFTPTLSGWNSYDLLLSSFTGLTNRTKIAQLIFSGLPVGGGTLFVDNVYFANTALANQSFVAGSVKMYPNPATDIFTIEAAKAIDSLQIYNVLGQEVFASTPKSNTTTVDVSAFKTGIYIAKTIIDGVSSSSRLVKR